MRWEECTFGTDAPANRERPLRSEGPQTGKHAGGLWTYRGVPQYGCRKNFYLVTIQLPQGAEIVAAEPPPAQTSVRDGVPTVRFQAIRDRSQKFTHMVQYRLPTGNAPQRAAK